MSIFSTTKTLRKTKTYTEKSHLKISTYDQSFNTEKNIGSHSEDLKIEIKKSDLRAE